MTDFAHAMPHGPIEPFVKDVYFVDGLVQMATLMRFPRMMAVLRHEGELTVVNAIRLDEAGEKALDELGSVKHLLRIGIHQLDDAYYVDRYGAKLWALDGAEHSGGLKTDHVYDESTELPVPDLRAVIFEHTKQPEAALLLERDDGVLITCDSVQNWLNTKGCSVMAKVAMRLMGFVKPAQIGPPWRKMMTPEGGSLKPDFERLADLNFEHLIPGHGRPIKGGANALLRATIQRVYE